MTKDEVADLIRQLSIHVCVEPAHQPMPTSNNDRRIRVTLLLGDEEIAESSDVVWIPSTPPG